MSSLREKNERVSLDHRAVFSRIYSSNTWLRGSGTGSQVSSTGPYRDLLQRMLNTAKLRRVVDLGCGDWEFSRVIDWSGIEYLGIDVVPAVVEENRRRYGSKHIRFRKLDLQKRMPPEADIYLLKDVLQHWTGAEIHRFLQRMEGRRLLITNTATTVPYWELDSSGGYRALDIRRPPFSIAAREVMRYAASPYDTKLVLFLEGGWSSRFGNA